MNILLVSSTPSDRGGIANWVRMVLDYAKKNQEEDFSLHHIAYGTYKAMRHGFWERFIKQGTDMFRIRREVRRKCRQERPDVIHITATGDWSVLRDILLLRCARRNKVNTVYQLRFGKCPEYREQNGRRWKLLSKAMHLASSIWTIDSKTYTVIRSCFADKDVRLVPNPVDVFEIEQIREQTDHKDNAVSFAGWVIKTKGIEELLSAWQKIRKDHKDTMLRLIGPYEQEYLASLKHRYSFEGVETTGKLDHAETLRLMAQSRAFVLPSYTEGFPNVVVEAMCLGIPIVASGVGAIPDMLSGECGAVVQAKSSEQLVNALSELLNDPEKAALLGQNAAQKAKNEYSLSVVFQLYQTLWAEVAEISDE